MEQTLARYSQQSEGISDCKNEISIFAGEQPATPQEVQNWVATMSVAFPRQTTDFWRLVGQMVVRDKISAKRLALIADRLMREHRYPILNISDILSIDARVKIYTGTELRQRFGRFPVPGYVILKQRGADGTIRLASAQDVQRYGLEVQQ